MKIMKISKYVIVQTPSRSSSETGTVRRMLLSLPRIKWLEREFDPTLHTSSYIPDDESWVTLQNMDSYVSLTKREEEIIRLTDRGMSPAQIADHKKMHVPNVLRSLDVARKKLAIIRSRRDNKNPAANARPPGDKQ